MILLDTHAIVWLASDPKRLSAHAKEAIRANPASLHVSVVSAWEIALLVKRGRLSLPLEPAEYLSRAIEQHGLIELPLSRPTVFDAVALPDIHNDPFDRILVAECQIRGLSLVSSDAIIPKYPDIDVIW